MRDEERGRYPSRNREGGETRQSIIQGQKKRNGREAVSINGSEEGTEMNQKKKDGGGKREECCGRNQCI